MKNLVVISAVLLAILQGEALLASPSASADSSFDVVPGCLEGRTPDSDPGIDFGAFYANEAIARRVASRIDESTFAVTARTAALGKGWVVRAAYRRVPTQQKLADDQIELGAIGVEFGGAQLMLGCTILPRERASRSGSGTD